jgi:molybdopterin synthase catalytic subunit
MIRVQEQPFDVGGELAALRGARKDIGGIALFVGTVRELGMEGSISSMTLEHYPGMTEAALAEIEAEAQRRWQLQDSLIVHRHGKLKPGDDIVLVIAASAHRQDAFEACQFLMDWLKTKAPFWKLESSGAGDHWVDAKTSDDALAARWERDGD